MALKIVHCRKEPYDVLIDRSTKWGNPFKIGPDGSRGTVIRKYETYLRKNKVLLGAISELKGKTLGCWCKPYACHGDVIAKIFDELQTEPSSHPFF